MQLYGHKANNDPESDLVIFEQFLRDPETSIPLNSNFLISFAAASMPLGIQTFNETATGDYEPKSWGLDIEKKKLIGNIESKYNYKCLFANGVNLPGESFGQKRVGMADLFSDNSGGLLSGVISTSREQKTALNISFLETNASFIDAVIRPWIVAATHYGLYARATDSPYNVKTDIVVLMFDHKTNSKSVIRKKFTFFGCVPTSFGEQQITFGKADTTITSVSWLYSNYSIETASKASGVSSALTAKNTIVDSLAGVKINPKIPSVANLAGRVTKSVVPYTAPFKVAPLRSFGGLSIPPRG